MLGHDFEGDEDHFSPEERNQLTFANNRIFKHKTLQVNYTTYDLRRAQDSLNPRTHADFMTLAHEDDDEHRKHPFWYGRILGIFHAMVQYTGPRSCSVDPQRMEFLWVRWYGRDLDHVGGWKAKHLHRVGFVDSEDPAAFGFLDPQEVIRGVHLIPAFAHGKTADPLPSNSMARTQCENHEDWQHFYISMLVNFISLLHFADCV